MELGNYFINPAYLYALLSLIPLILIYLIKPKPTKKIIPSLMFFFKNMEKSKFNAFLRYFTKNFLLFIQLLVLLFLSLAIATPYLSSEGNIKADNTVIILDVSASMQTKSGLTTRFDKAVDIVNKNLGKRNTLILIKDTPELILKEESEGKIKTALSKITPTDTTSNIAEAIMFGAEQLEKGRVVVVSDFIATGNDPYSAKKLIESKGIPVDFFDVSSKANNIGITDLIVNEENSVAYVKNFNDKEENIEISIENLKKTLTIQPKSVETFHFTTPAGATSISINVNDDFPADDKAYISSYSSSKLRTLVITNNENNNMYHALASSSALDVQVSEPPIVEKIEHDIVVVRDVNTEVILEETINEIMDNVKNGGILIVAAQNDLFKIDFKDLLPVEKGELAGETRIKTELSNKYTKDISFGSVKEHLKTTTIKGATIAAGEDNSSIIVYSDYGKGKVLYYGIDDSKSNFKLTPWYPIFWDNMVRFLLARDDISQLNFRTGIRIGEDTYNKAGIYDIKTKKIAVNLLDEKESDVSKEKTSEEQARISSKQKEFREQKARQFDIELLALGMLLLFAELLFIKFRGDL